MKNKIIAIIVCAVALAGCDNLPFGKIHDAKEKVRYQLNDGDSAKFREVRASAHFPGVICGEVNAKNGYGAYVGYKLFYLYQDIASIESVEDTETYYDIYHEVCGNALADSTAQCISVSVGSDYYVGSVSGNFDSCYKNGEKHGEWIYRKDGLTKGEGMYVDGKKHGQWREGQRGGWYVEGTYVDGKKHGVWETRLAVPVKTYCQVHNVDAARRACERDHADKSVGDMLATNRYSHGKYVGSE